MKKALVLFTLILLLLVKDTFAISYNDKIKINLTPNVENTLANINWANLIERYVTNFKSEIEGFKEKYNITSDKEINNFLKKLDKMTNSLKIIQTYSVEKETAWEVMRSVVNELKIVNPKIKSYLKVRKSLVIIETKNVKNNYVIFSCRLAKSLTKFINDVRKRETNENRNQIEKHLKALKLEGNKLINFGQLNFDNPNEVKSKFLIILNNINNEFTQIKKILKK